MSSHRKADRVVFIEDAFGDLAGVAEAGECPYFFFGSPGSMGVASRRGMLRVVRRIGGAGSEDATAMLSQIKPDEVPAVLWDADIGFVCRFVDIKVPAWRKGK